MPEQLLKAVDSESLAEDRRDEVPEMILPLKVLRRRELMERVGKHQDGIITITTGKDLVANGDNCY